jgi:hypothetical protein
MTSTRRKTHLKDDVQLPAFGSYVTTGKAVEYNFSLALPHGKLDDMAKAQLCAVWGTPPAYFDEFVTPTSEDIFVGRFLPIEFLQKNHANSDTRFESVMLPECEGDP